MAITPATSSSLNIGTATIVRMPPMFGRVNCTSDDRLEIGSIGGGDT